MCGRGRCTLRADDIPRACYVTTSNNDNNPVQTIQMDRYRPAYNVSPGNYVPVVRRADVSDGPGVVVHCMKWGLIPSFTRKDEKPDHYRMFNARSESINEKASFRCLVPKSRCLVAMEGFYEWKKDGSKKQPYYIHLKDGRPLVFAALYDSWKNPEGEILYTFTILTTSASSSLQWLHDRMPVIFGDKESADAWLNGSSSINFDTLLKPYEQPDLVWYAVTPAMGKPFFDGPECIEQVQLKTEETPSISKFFSKKGGHTLKSEVKSLSDEENKLNPRVTSNEGSGIVEEAKPTSLPKMQCDVKSSHGGSVKKQVKREHEEISADTKPKADEIKSSGASPHPARKKGKVKETAMSESVSARLNRLVKERSNAAAAALGPSKGKPAGREKRRRRGSPSAADDAAPVPPPSVIHGDASEEMTRVATGGGSSVLPEDVEMGYASRTAPIFVPNWGVTTNDEAYNNPFLAQEIVSRVVLPRDLARQMEVTEESFIMAGDHDLYRVMTYYRTMRNRLQVKGEYLAEVSAERGELKQRLEATQRSHEELFLREQELSKRFESLQLSHSGLMGRNRELEGLLGTAEEPGSAILRARAEGEESAISEMADAVLANYQRGIRDAKNIVHRTYPELDLSHVHKSAPSISDDDSFGGLEEALAAMDGAMDDGTSHADAPDSAVVPPADD